MSPTFFSDIYIGITATITATLPPKQYLHRHFTPEQKAVFKEKSAGIYEEYRQIVGDSVIDLFTKDYKE